jgi:hypothetical protein
MAHSIAPAAAVYTATETTATPPAAAAMQTPSQAHFRRRDPRAGPRALVRCCAWARAWPRRAARTCGPGEGRGVGQAAGAPGPVRMRTFSARNSCSSSTPVSRKRASRSNWPTPRVGHRRSRLALAGHVGPERRRAASDRAAAAGGPLADGLVAACEPLAGALFELAAVGIWKLARGPASQPLKAGGEQDHEQDCRDRIAHRRRRRPPQHRRGRHDGEGAVRDRGLAQVGRAHAPDGRRRPRGYSRVDAGVHFPSDVLLGALVGTSAAHIRVTR